MAPAPAAAEPSASSGTSSSMAAAGRRSPGARQAPDRPAPAAALLPGTGRGAGDPGSAADHRTRVAPRPDTPRTAPEAQQGFSAGVNCDVAEGCRDNRRAVGFDGGGEG